MLWVYDDIVYLHDATLDNIVVINFQTERFLFNSKEVRSPVSKD